MQAWGIIIKYFPRMITVCWYFVLSRSGSVIATAPSFVKLDERCFIQYCSRYFITRINLKFFSFYFILGNHSTHSVWRNINEIIMSQLWCYWINVKTFLFAHPFLITLEKWLRPKKVYYISESTSITFAINKMKRNWLVSLRFKFYPVLEIFDFFSTRKFIKTKKQYLSELHISNIILYMY
jgi:hypothetical protein